MIICNTPLQNQHQKSFKFSYFLMRVSLTETPNAVEIHHRQLTSHVLYKGYLFGSIGTNTFPSYLHLL